MASNSIKGITIEIAGNTSKLVQSLDEATKAANAAQNNLKKINQALKLDPGNIEILAKKQELLNHAIEATKQRLDAEKAAAEAAKEALDLGQITQSQYDAITAGIANTEARLHDLENQAQDTERALSGVGEDVNFDSASGSVQDLHDSTELLSKGLEVVSDVGAKAGDALAAGFDVAASAAQAAADAALKVGELSVQAVRKTGEISYEVSTQVLDAYGNYEQLVGGVEKIFGSSADIVRRNARAAFATATMSANDYLQTVTGFSASLLQGLGGDTREAARLADMALSDMSDNANTYGTDIQSIISAYQGFAKGSYNMLDNLRLGYGGTQTEMVRLINDSHILNETISDLDGITFDQIIEAINAVQTELHITGTTSREAATTVEGSLNMLRASWQNLLVDLGRSDTDASRAAQDVADSLVTVANNVEPILRRVSNNLPRILPIVLDGIKDDIPEAVRVVGMVMNAVGQSAVDAAPEVIDMIADNLPESTAIVSQLLRNLSNGLRENAPALVDAAGEILPEFATLGADILGIIIQTIVENAPEAARQMGAALSPVLDEVFGEGSGAAFQEAIDRLIEGAPALAELVDPLMRLGETLIKDLPVIVDTAIPLLDFAANHLPEIVGGLVAIQGAGVLASIASGVLNIASSVAILQGSGGIAAMLSGITSAASGAAASLGSVAAVAGPIALLTAEVAALGVEAYTLHDLVQQGEAQGISAFESITGGILQVVDTCSLGATSYADMWLEMNRAADDAELDAQAQEIFDQINASIESSGAAATESVRDDCEVIQSYLDNLEANGQVELRARVITEYQSVYTQLGNEQRRNTINSSQREMADRYAREGRRNTPEARAVTAYGQDMANRYRQQGEEAIRAIQETASAAQETIRTGGGGGGGGGGGSSKSDDKSALTASKAEELLTSIDDHIVKLLERFGVVTEQSDYQKNVNQMIDGVLAALNNNYTDAGIETAVNELKRTMEAYGMDSSVIDATTLEQLRNLVNQPQAQTEAFSQMQNSVSAIQAVAIDYTPFFEAIASSVAQILVLKQNESHITNVYLDGREVQATVVEAIESYNYEMGGH